MPGWEVLAIDGTIVTGRRPGQQSRCFMSPEQVQLEQTGLELVIGPSMAAT
jgi:hypothetical protein